MESDSNHTAVTKEATKSPWLNAWYDPLADIKTWSSCVRLSDLSGDGDYKLVVCDLNKLIKVYKGTALVVENALLDVPVSLCINVEQSTGPRYPSVAVAAGSHIFMYRQLRPFKKWSCPYVEISPVETDIWNNLTSDDINFSTAYKMLNDAREAGTILSSKSAEFLSLENDNDKISFINASKGVQHIQQTVITAMEVLKLDSEDIDSVGLLVVGTEAGQIIILPQDPFGSLFLCKIDLPSVPVLIATTGVFSVEWRLSVVCRDGKLYSIKNGDVRNTAVLTGTIIDLGSQAVSIAKQDKLLWVATMDRVISCYNARGKRVKSIILTEDISELCIMSIKKSKISNLLLVALSSGEIRMYSETTLVHSFHVEGPVSAMRFGPYGREENSLILVHGKGCVTVKMWRRTAELENKSINAGPPPEQDIPLAVPKKTKLYVEQTQREKEQASEMHKSFQRDLCRMRLDTARAYVKTLTDGHMGASPVGSPDVKIHVQVQGLGPNFLLKITLQNAGTQPILEAKLLFSFESDLYVMGHSINSRQCMSIPILLPGPKHFIETEVLNIDPQGRSGQIIILMHHSGSSSSLPMLSAQIRMPTSELFN